MSKILTLRVNIPYTPCLLKPVLNQLTYRPIDLISLFLCQSEDVKDDVVKGLPVR